MLHFYALGTLDLRDGEGRELRGLSQSKPLGLLAYLILAKPYGYHRRDQLAALFWPELDSVKARAALSRAIYQLRSAVGAEVIVSRGDEALAVNRAHLRSDAGLIEEMCARRDWKPALDLYRGDLLAGLHLSSVAPEFDAWLETRRAELRSLAAIAAWQLVEESEAADRLDDAIHHARRYLALRPAEETALRNVMRLLDRAGDKAAAAGVYQEFATRLASEFELEPSSETKQLLDRIKARAPQPADRTGTRMDRANLDLRLRAEPSAAGEQTEPAQTRRTLFYTAVATGMVLLVALGLRGVWARADAPPPLAVGDITSTLPADSVRGFTTLLSVNLGRIETLDVISEQRLAELQAAHPTTSGAALARRAGARQVLEGVLARADGDFRLDLRRVDVATGNSRASYSVSARNLFQLADQLTEEIARDFGLRAHAARSNGSTGSIVAYQLYEQGLRALPRGDRAGAFRLFSAALQHDSTFAMAAMLAAHAADGAMVDSLLARAYRLADGVTDRERLYIKSYWASRINDPRMRVWAETLVARYPTDPDAHVMLARALNAQRDMDGAFRHFEQVIALDSANAFGAVRCRACEAAGVLIPMYLGIDSIRQAQRLVDLILRWEPQKPGPWYMQSVVLGHQGRYHEANVAYDSAYKYSPEATELDRTAGWYYTNEFDRIDRAWRELLDSPRPELRAGALWTRVVSSRVQGRIRDALAAARAYRRMEAERDTVQRDPFIRHAILEAVVLLDAGQARHAGALWDSMAIGEPARDPARKAQWQTGYWLRAADAYAAAGDSLQLRRLEDSVRIHGAKVLNGRHHLLHHHVRGLRLKLQGRHAEAAAQFKLALPFAGFNYVRSHLEFGRAALLANRPAEAIPVLVNGLKGPTSSVGLYATRSELQELLGEAYQRNAQPDSAIIQYRNALYAWRNADPEFNARKARLQARIDSLSKARPLRR